MKSQWGSWKQNPEKYGDPLKTATQDYKDIKMSSSIQQAFFPPAIRHIPHMPRGNRWERNAAKAKALPGGVFLFTVYASF